MTRLSPATQRTSTSPCWRSFANRRCSVAGEPISLVLITSTTVNASFAASLTAMCSSKHISLASRHGLTLIACSISCFSSKNLKYADRWLGFIAVCVVPSLRREDCQLNHLFRQSLGSHRPVTRRSRQSLSRHSRRQLAVVAFNNCGRVAHLL